MKLHKKVKRDIQNIVAILFLILPVVMAFNNWMNSEEVIVSASNIVSTTTPSPSPTPALPTERHAYVYEVFGEDYDKALLVLQGVKKDGKQICGGENYNLRPEAVNINKDGSKDYSIFQVNDNYHPVYKLNLHTDWKANIRYAHRMFSNDGGTFSKRWTAGKCLKANGYNI